MVFMTPETLVGQMYVHIYTHIDTYICVAGINEVCICVCIYIHTYAYTNMCVYIYKAFLHAGIKSRSYTFRSNINRV